MNNTQDSNRLLGESANFLEVFEHVSQIASLNKPVLVVGERGTGKELVAERLHFLSPRWDQSFIKMNCAAISETLLESELFGHESGAFTGASKQHQGRFERANNGTLFLDELANTSPSVQEKLLRVIEYGEFERVGGKKTVQVNVRLVAATNEDLPTLASAGKFREDLLDRLAFDVITLPPLRERQEDILLLAEHFAISMTKEMEYEYFPGFAETIKQALLDFRWPGNIRELKNVIERSVYRHQGSDKSIHQIEFDPFDSPYRPGSNKIIGPTTASQSANVQIQDDISVGDFKQSVADFEVKLIKSALKNHQFSQKKTAEALGLTYHQLRGYLKKYDLLND